SEGVAIIREERTPGRAAPGDCRAGVFAACRGAFHELGLVTGSPDARGLCRVVGVDLAAPEERRLRGLRGAGWDQALAAQGGQRGERRPVRAARAADRGQGAAGSAVVTGCLTRKPTGCNPWAFGRGCPMSSAVPPQETGTPAQPGAPPAASLLPAEKVKQFPAAPGVYLMKDEQGRVLYVGKAKNLRNRAGHYFTRAAAEDRRTAD